MASTEMARGATYRLRRGDSAPLAAAVAHPHEGHAFPNAFFVANALWFCKLRWAVIALLAVFGLAQWGLPELWYRIGLRAHAAWPFAISGMLVAANVLFQEHVRRLSAGTSALAVRTNLWGQILVDLLVLTVVVHYTGSLETIIPFVYLLHIVLACLFFSRPESFVATMVASAAYVSCVIAETVHFVEPASIYLDPAFRAAIERHVSLISLGLGSTVTIWLVVWYLASRLSGLIRERDRELTETNERLGQVQAERSKHMLRTTHELKAPFAAIHANADLLLKGYCGELPSEARAVVERIATRSQRLAIEIHEMLDLARLQSASETPLARTQVRLDTVLRWCIAQVQVTARQRNVTLVAELAPVAIMAVEEHLRLLFSNLLSNAVTYSYAGGRVEVACQRGENQDPIVRIEDHGIGIPEDKLPLIFDEYYRTDEAVRHNKNSTGLGLAIVRHVAELHGIEITVRSTLGTNTTFELRFPRD